MAPISPNATSGAAGPAAAVTLVIPSIHCPSCVAYLEERVAELLGASASHLSASLVNHSLSFRLEATAGAARANDATPSGVDATLHALARQLDRDGFPVEEVQVVRPTGNTTTNTGSPVARVFSPRSGRRAASHRRAPSSVTSMDAFLLSTSSSQQQQQQQRQEEDEEERRWRMHRASCKACATLQHPPSTSAQAAAAAAAAAMAEAERQGEAAAKVETQAASVAGATADAHEARAAVGAPRQDGRRGHDDVRHPEQLRVELAVTGMTCSSCVSNIERAVSDLPGLTDFTVELLCHSATAHVISERAAHSLVEAIEDAGYQAELVSVRSVAAAAADEAAAGGGATGARRDARSATKARRRWRAKLSVAGMTCASCAQHVQRAAREALPPRRPEDEDEDEDDDGGQGGPVVSAEVALLSNSLDVQLRARDEAEARALAQAVAQSVDDAGFECSLVEMREVQGVAATADATPSGAPLGVSPTPACPTRTVKVRVEGMFCPHCVDKVKTYLEQRRGGGAPLRVPDLDRFSLAHPELVVSYTSLDDSADGSEARAYTLRQLLSEITALDPAFEARYVVPPSLASRSAQLAAEELRGYVVRLGLASLFAAPTAVVAVVSPILLAPDDALRSWLETPLVGSACRGDVVLGALATPCLFGVGRVFFSRAYKSLRSAWRPGRRWGDRLLRWGDMNVLVALGTSVAYFASLAFLVVDANQPPPKTSHERQEGMVFFDATVFLIFFILLGRVLEAWSKRKTGDAVAALGALRPTTGLLLSPTEAATNSLPSSSLSAPAQQGAGAGASMGSRGGGNGGNRMSGVPMQPIPMDVYLLEVGDVVLIPSGASPPLDCEIVEAEDSGGGAGDSKRLSAIAEEEGVAVGPAVAGSTTLALFDESAITGESRAVRKSSGDAVFAGTVNVGRSAVRARVTSSPGESLLDGILEAVRQAGGRKADVERLADRLTSYFVPAVVALSTLTLVTWTLVLYSDGDHFFSASRRWIEERVPGYREGRSGARLLWALRFAVSCLVVACPCGIGLAAPTAQMAGVGVASRYGLLVKGGGEVLQAASERKRRLAVVLDKTGTLTRGEGGEVVQAWTPKRRTSDAAPDHEEIDEPTLWDALERAEQASTHPIAEALRRYCSTRRRASATRQPKRDAGELIETEEVTGEGLVARFEHLELLVGNARLLGRFGCDIDVSEGDDDGGVAARAEQWRADASTVVFVGARWRAAHRRDDAGAPTDGGEGVASDQAKRSSDLLPSPRLMAMLGVADPVRREARRAVASLRRHFDAEVWMVSGDAPTTAHAVARLVGIEARHVVAGVLPEGKQEWVRRIAEGDVDAGDGRRGSDAINGGDGSQDDAADVEEQRSALRPQQRNGSIATETTPLLSRGTGDVEGAKAQSWTWPSTIWLGKQKKSSGPMRHGPNQGDQWRRSRQRRRQRLVMAVGDGINDSPMLASAAVGVAMGGGTSVAASSASVVLLRRDAPLLCLPNLVSVARATTRKVRANLAWACAFNLAMVPLAAGALQFIPERDGGDGGAPWLGPLAAPHGGWQLGPTASALAMAASSVSVVVSALTLRLWKPIEQFD